jgi:hypothetical protein
MSPKRPRLSSSGFRTNNSYALVIFHELATCQVHLTSLLMITLIIPNGLSAYWIYTTMNNCYIRQSALILRGLINKQYAKQVWIGTKTRAFWDIAPWGLGVERRFRGAYCLHHQGHSSPWRWRQYASIETTCHYIPDGSNLHTCRRENLKSPNICTLLASYEL